MRIVPHLLLQGKTEALLAVSSMLGFHKRSPCSGDSTKSALFERTSQQADLSVTVDDVVVPQGESRTFQQIIRALYDCSTRTVTGKIRRPKSTAMFTVCLFLNVKTVLLLRAYVIEKLAQPLVCV